MHKPLWIGLLLGVIAYVTCDASAQSQALPGNTQKTARIALAQEFVRELEVLYRLQETAKKEFAEDSSGAGKLTTGIRVGRSITSTRLAKSTEDEIVTTRGGYSRRQSA